MKNNTLVLIDWTAGLIISPLIILVKAVKKVASKFYRPQRNGRLLIKFLGAGNYVAMSEVIDDNTTLVSAASNRAAIERFLNPKAVFYIDDSGFLSLVKTALGAIFCVCKGSFHEVINLETESKFAKLLTALARADRTMGITNVHKSYLDFIIYDRCIVNPVMMSKDLAIELLTDFRLIQNPHAMASIKQSQMDFFEALEFPRGIRQVAFAPTGSDTDTIRRLHPEIWSRIATKLVASFPDIKICVYFPSQLDPQYQDISALLSQLAAVEICIGNYNDYVSGIERSDLVVCIDSQTLHIANRLDVPVVCFFGPSSPYGVNHTTSTCPISMAAACSPCRHKYFTIPCEGMPVCMDFQEIDLEVFDQLRSWCK